MYAQLPVPNLQPSQYHLLQPCLFHQILSKSRIYTVTGFRTQSLNKPTAAIKYKAQTMLGVSASNRGSVMWALQKEQLSKWSLLCIRGQRRMGRMSGWCVVLVNPYVLYELGGGVVRRLILAAVSETVRNVFQFVIRHRSNKQMAAYSTSS